MPQRVASYKASKGVESSIPALMVDEMVKRVMNEAYDNNLVLRENALVRRFQLWTVKGKIATGGEILDAIRNCPEDISYLLPIVYLTEEHGEDVLSVVLNSEILEALDLNSCPRLRSLAEQPPNITLEALLQAHEAEA